MGSVRYPETQMPYAQKLREQYQRFAELREELLLDYGYNTARAYWGDLQHWFEWAVGRGKDVLALTQEDIRQYVALLRRRKYSENTIRRRITALRLLYEVAVEAGAKRQFNGTNSVAQIVTGCAL